MLPTTVKTMSRKMTPQAEPPDELEVVVFFLGVVFFFLVDFLVDFLVPVDFLVVDFLVPVDFLELDDFVEIDTVVLRSLMSS